MSLTPKQQTFVDEYLVDLNATQAAIRAGYSKKTARAIAQQNLTKLDIQQAIQKAQQKRSERVQITQDSVLEGIVRCTNASEEAADYKTALKGYELQGKHLGLFTERVENKVTGPDGGPVQYDIRMTFVRPQRRDDGAGD
jgi:phage terminase small subunit